MENAMQLNYTTDLNVNSTKTGELEVMMYLEGGRCGVQEEDAREFAYHIQRSIRWCVEEHIDEVLKRFQFDPEGEISWKLLWTEKVPDCGVRFVFQLEQ